MNSKVTGEGDDVVQKTALPKTVTFEPRRENKSCSACPEDHFLYLQNLKF